MNHHRHPTRLCQSIWEAPSAAGPGLHGWRFQGTSDSCATYMLDVYRGTDGWHVHDIYT